MRSNSPSEIKERQATSAQNQKPKRVTLAVALES